MIILSKTSEGGQWMDASERMTVIVIDKLAKFVHDFYLKFKTK